ncbi:SRPBCC family protein [Lacinutrix sp. Bg11-31]|uniref:SRPBCC family protein n=1 Tax=Lacinutrix sp. Bg11-31 TaxID=2057808 RepID=UPI000C301C1C|nr:SRPBCC family protein [Lacinutrix sp. Bg11-31]AUC82011.1 SRPBCC family protein [Lacinutrix sp. Bg11-31]
MKYTSQIIVEVPLELFIKKLDSLENKKHWQRGLESVEHVSGDPGRIGAKMKLNYSFGKRKMTLLETITENVSTSELHVIYDTKGMHNIQHNYFNQTQEGYTKWICKSEFIPTNFFMHFMTLLAPKSFKKQSMVYLNDFKNFAEKGTSVEHA